MKTPFNPFSRKVDPRELYIDGDKRRSLVLPDGGPVGLRLTVGPDSPFKVPEEVQFLDRVETVTVGGSR